MADDLPDHPALDELDDRASTRLDRREFLGFIGATLAGAACGETPGGADRSRSFPAVDDTSPTPDSPPPPAPTLPNDPFTLGVASGEPLPDGVLLWTRLAPEPLNGGGMPDRDVPVIWEVARDENFEEIVDSGWLYTQPELGHSAHVDVRDLDPDTWYFYRFRVGDQWVSPVAETRTFPRPDAEPERLRLASASCQNYKDGYYTAHRHMADEPLDVVAFLGDYIYEYGGGGAVRDHQGPTLTTLEEFRQRYALYKTDPQLQAAHANCPWLVTWDDHEVSNNYAGDEPAKGWIDDFKRMRAAAYQAYYEHMPLRVPFPDDPSSLEIFRRRQFGDLANLFVLDGRQYRSGVVCEDSDLGPPCDAVDSPRETMLGARQRAWMVEEMTRSETIWNIVCQQTVMTPFEYEDGPIDLVNPDQWDGYQAERRQLFEFFGSDAVDNVTVLTGDIHTGGFAEIPTDENRPQDSPRAGLEIVATSITSGSSLLDDTGDLPGLILDEFPHIHYFNAADRGYCVLEYTRDECIVRYRTVSTVKEREAKLSRDAVFVIDAEDMSFTRRE